MAEGDKPIPAELFDEEGELDNAVIFCSKCGLSEADDVSLIWRGRWCMAMGIGTPCTCAAIRAAV